MKRRLPADDAAPSRKRNTRVRVEADRGDVHVEIGDRVERLPSPDAFATVIAAHKTIHFYECLKAMETNPEVRLDEINPALAPGVAIVECEGAAATPIDADGKATHIGVEDQIVAPLGGNGLS